MIRIVKEFLTYSRSERRGIIILMVLLTGINTFRYFMPLQTTGKPLPPEEFFARADSFLAMVKGAEQQLLSGHQYQSRDKRKQYINIYDTLVIALNQADTLDLQLLRGIGPWFAKNIVRYRKALGGFCKKEQLLEVYGMDSARYEGILENVTIDTAFIQKLNINDASLKQLLRHPYFDYHVVRAILISRSEKSGFNSKDELLELDVVYPELYDKIKPYITLQ
jgi:DNA uptake protein ComE-like DNA-binding protein